ncbi:ABC transporter ATP-binding protein [Paenibacillus sp. TRM 82003]|nr:ABC transporter ATP-binding protein [Paenibacillus sp. TRM 82003]
MESILPLLQFVEVTKRFAGRSVLRRLNFAVRPGETVAVVGGNGSGKSTLLRIATGLVAVDGGRVERPGDPALRIGYAPDRLPVLKFTSEQYLRHMGAIQGMARERLLPRVAELHERFELSAGSPARLSHYSKGMLQKVNLMQALLGGPKLLLLDEPLSGLDEKTQQELFAVLEGLKREGVAIVAATHEPELMQRLADRCVTLRDGEMADVSERARPRGRLVVCTAPAATLEALKVMDGLAWADIASGQGCFLVQEEASDRFLLAALKRGASIASVTAADTRGEA